MCGRDHMQPVKPKNIYHLTIYRKVYQSRDLMLTGIFFKTIFYKSNTSVNFYFYNMTRDLF